MLFELVGNIILTYGNLEKTIELVIGFYFEKILESKKANHLAQIVVSKNSNAKSKIEILEDLVKRTAMSEEMKNNWDSLFSDLYELNKIRNLLAHNFYGIDNDKLIKLKRNADEVLSIEELQKYKEKLNGRYRQLFDSFIEPIVIENVVWVSEYPLLKFE